MKRAKSNEHKGVLSIILFKLFVVVDEKKEKRLKNKFDFCLYYYEKCRSKIFTLAGMDFFVISGLSTETLNIHIK